jgi:hypothetical protein
MSAVDDRKMFAPLRHGEPIAPEAKLVEALKLHGAGATAAALADGLLRSGAVVGLRRSVIERIQELLEDLEQAARVERIPDGRYRAVKTRVRA